MKGIFKDFFSQCARPEETVVCNHQRNREMSSDAEKLTNSLPSEKNDVFLPSVSINL